MNTPIIENHSFLDALALKPAHNGKTPIWLMRQAGRYLAEYRATRAKAGSFMQLAKNPDLAMEVTLQPLARFDLDAAILFSDILTIPDAMGLGLDFIQGEGPKFARPLQHEHDIKKLQSADMNELNYVFNAIRAIKKGLCFQKTEGSSEQIYQRVPLIGFSGSPWTLACYMVEGEGSHNDFIIAKKMLYQRPDLMQKIIEINTQSVIEYLDQQIQAGCDAVMIFDSWGGLLPTQAFNISFHSIEMIINALNQRHPNTPKIVFSKGIGMNLERFNALNCNGLGVDWSMDLAWARKIIQPHKALQGNLDPMYLFSNPDVLMQATHDMLSAYYQVHNSLDGYIANLGHGILQHTPPENVSHFIEAVRSFKPFKTVKQ
jgi:uroporphyrinogen decarboxylase